MKVLKEGSPQKGWAKRFKCTGGGNGNGGCGAVLLVEFGDLFTTESHARDETTTYVTFKCSSCGVLTDIDRKDGPENGSIGLPSKAAWERRNKGVPVASG